MGGDQSGEVQPGQLQNKLMHDCAFSAFAACCVGTDQSIPWYHFGHTQVIMSAVQYLILHVASLKLSIV